MLLKILRTPLPHPPQVKVNNWFPTISLTSRPRVLPIVSIQDGTIRSNKMQDSQQSFRVLRCDHRPCCQRRRLSKFLFYGILRRFVPCLKYLKRLKYFDYFTLILRYLIFTLFFRWIRDTCRIYTAYSLKEKDFLAYSITS